MLEYFVRYFINLEFKITYPITNLLQCISIVFMFMPFEKSGKYLLKRIRDILIVFLAYIVLGSFYYMILGDPGHKYFILVVYSILIVLYALLFSKLKAVVRVIHGFILLSSFTAAIEISATVGNLMQAAFDIDPIPVNIFINFLIFYIDIFIVNFIPFNDEERISPENVIVIVFVTIVIMIMQIFGISTSDYKEFTLFIFTALWMTEMITYYLSYRLTHMQNVNLVLTVEALQRENAENLVLVSEQNIRKIREFKHDEQNKFLTLKMLLENNKIEEAKEFFNELEIDLKSVDDGIAIIDCGNSILNAIVNIEDNKAKSYGVKLETNIIVPAKMNIEGNELSGLLMNLIDNAIEGTVAADKIDVPVSANIKLVNEMLFIQVINAVSEVKKNEKELSLKTTKDEKTHGYGVKIVKRIVKKYNGHIDYRIEGEKLYAEVMLQLGKEEK